MGLKDVIIDGFLKELDMSRESFDKLTGLLQSVMDRIEVTETDEHLVIDIEVKKLHIKIDK